MVDFFPRHIAAWMDGTEGLEDGEYRAYDVICNLIYLNGGPIALHESGIAGRCNQHVLRFRQNLKKLVEKKKIVVLEDGKITNLRVESELTKIDSRRRAKTPNPPGTPAQPRGGRRGVGRGLEEGSENNPLKNKEPTLFEDGTKERKKVTLPNGKANESGAMRDPPPDPEADLFRRGREILGASAGGMIKKLLMAKGGNVAIARAALETASQRGDAREYVGAMVRGMKTGAPSRNGFAALMVEGMGEENAEDFFGGNGSIIDAEPVSDRRTRHNH